MKNLNWLALGFLAALFAAACDPYPKENKSPPQILAITATDVAGDATSGTFDATAGWSVTGIPSTCTAATGPLSDQPVFFVTLNKLMDETSIQSGLKDCTPANNWLTVTPAPSDNPDTGHPRMWYSCFNPSSVSPDEGGSIVIYLADKESPAVCDPTDTSSLLPGASVSQAWADQTKLDTSNVDFTTVTFAGSVKDKQGRDLAIDFKAQFDPDAGSVRNLFVDSGTASSVTLRWRSAPCADATATTYSIGRFNAAAGDFEQIGTAPVGTTTFTDNTATAGAPNTYAVFTKIAIQNATPAVTVTKEKASVADVLPGFGPITGPPTLDTSSLQATKVVISWTALTGADSYDILRAKNSGANQGTVGGTAGTFSTLRSALVGTTYTDVAASGGTQYSYAIVPRKTVIVGTGAAATEVLTRGAINPVPQYLSVLTPPSKPAPPSLSSTDVAVNIEWSALTGITSYDVQRAPSNPDGTAGNFATIFTDTVAAADTPDAVPTRSFSDTTVTAGTTYWYRIIANNDSGTNTGDPSNVTTRVLATPAAPTATAGTASVAVSWTAVTGAASYLVQRSSDNGAPSGAAGDSCRNPAAFMTIASAVTGTTFTDDTVTSGSYYYYSVTAVNAAGASSAASAPSNVVLVP